ncbi:polysaccharide biosynthesis protein [Lachnospiraceae bacterium WCA-9-b2]|jgi:FlaA1/EpsC-like NDP-sugar epimerase|uniref:Polysaccharide biosynthesis protein n=1 Tax=Sporofaciens musculi TaxID=2681861 RepID=A0A7X3SHV2_9FIRM|nr:nucleoside-diphosphate sugar epimerase/dehydratase [Sporofaciens musculi]MCI9423243.1 polysaccharide biosynthesis protein [Dorea sp.]MXP74769.1 polysaccharide biosynthesis protein [Sporofaciens musculi]
MNKIWEGRGVPWVHQAILVAFLDALFVVISYGAALILRFDFSFSSIPEAYRSGYLWSMPFWIASTIVVFYAFRLYHSIWRLASISELQMSIAAYIVLLPVYGLGIIFMHLRMPKAYYFMGFIISFCMTTALRFSYRMFQTYFGNREGAGDEEQNRIMVIGGGAAGQTLIRELINSRRLHTKVCCVIDDNPNKIGRVLEGIPIVGNRDDILTMVDRYKINHIIYAIPATTGKNQKEILNICKETKCRLQTVPGVYQLVNGEVSVSKLRDVDIADLLGRAQVKVNNDEIFRAIRRRKVLVTGGGGSIGSELCRQIAKAKPKQLIIFDIYENNAYEIQQELRRSYPQLDLVVLIGSVRNSNRINQVMHTYKPDIVYHAAAHKHVPLMEDSPNEAIKNNVLGTYKTAMAAAKVGVKKFVLISTDKAVNPTNIMGASKRLCEMVVQMMNRKTDTDFVAVRFGNVLGSNGSVIPLFKKQIAEGGPVTVTDKDIIRYFMTIPEAVALVLQASYYAEGGEIFVLDMGDPVRIDDMARNLIRLSGYEPDVDIPIVYTGLRPGEKLFEELLMDEEGLKDTANEMIHIGHPIEMDDEWFEEKLKLLDKVSRQDSARIKEIVAEVVPTYHYKK